MSNAKVRLLRLFVTSYAPLAIILAVQHSENVWPPATAPAFWMFAAVGTFGLIDAHRLPRGALRKGHQRTNLTDIVDEGGQVAAYIATYLLPFLGFQIYGWRDGTAIGIYFAILLVVFLRSDLALVNPTLYLAGWRVVSARSKGRRVLILIPNGIELAPGDAHVIGFGSFLVYDGKVQR